MFGFKGKYGFSFSLSRLIGLAGAKNSIARKTGIPTTRGGLERKIGRKIINLFFK
jgi:hypothetical protein